MTVEVTSTVSTIPIAALSSFVSGAVGILLGSLLSYHLKQYELRQAELTGRIDDIISEIKSIEAMAAKYWSTATGVEQQLTENLLLGSLHRVSELISYCRERNAAVYDGDLDDKLIVFRQIVSGAPFGETRTSAEASKARGLVGAATDLIICVRRTRRSVL